MPFRFKKKILLKKSYPSLQYIFCVVSLFYSSACILSHCRFLWSDFFRLYTKVIFLDGNIAITIHVVCTRYLVFPYIFLQEPWLAKNTKNMPFFVCFRPFLVQTDNHIIKALGINYSYWSKDQSCSISQRILRIDGFDKHSFFWVSHFGPFWNFFLLETMKSRQW